MALVIIALVVRKIYQTEFGGFPMTGIAILVGYRAVCPLNMMRLGLGKLFLDIQA